MAEQGMETIKNLTIKPVDDPTQYFDLLLQADPSPDLVRDYLKVGHLYGGIFETQIVGAFVLLNKGERVWELKNITVTEQYQGRGFGRALMQYAIAETQSLGGKTLEVGTGNSSLSQLRFYEAAGFQRSHVDKGFFTRNYDEPIFENGVLCKDMIFLAIEF
jgi:ribosomal protein S18 acetylase RimI-like enzyme